MSKESTALGGENPKAIVDDPVSLAPLKPEQAFQGLFKVKPPAPVKRGPKPKTSDE